MAEITEYISVEKPTSNGGDERGKTIGRSLGRPEEK